MRRAVVTALAAAFVLVALVLLRSDGEPYSVSMSLKNAAGLSTGSPVTIGGVTIGTVKLSSDQDRVEANLQIDDKYAPLDRKVKATILARNALGQKQVVLEPRSGSLEPARDGYRLPATQVKTATDLDQLLGTLDPDTRSRLAVVLNEAGLAFDGRKVDFKQLLTELGPGLSAGSDLLGQLTQDNRALTNLLTTSDRFIATVAGERSRLTRTIDLLGRTTENVASRRAELRETLRRAPATLASARTFLGELRRTTGPLAATARRLTATAPPLLTTIQNIEPLRAAAKPTLDAAVKAAPTVSALTERTTSSLRGALPALDSVNAASQKEIPPVGTALDGSMDNLLAVLENWSRAIQFRDGSSHIFRGEASFAPSVYEPFLAAAGLPLPTNERSKKTAPRPATPAPPLTAEPAPARPTKPPVDVPGVVKRATEAVDKALGTDTKPVTQSTTDLLDYLLGP